MFTIILLSALLSSIIAVPIHPIARDIDVEPSCEALPWWKEYSDLGMGVFPDPQYITPANATNGWYTINLFNSTFNWFELQAYGKQLAHRFAALGLKCDTPDPVTINVFAREIKITGRDATKKDVFDECFTWNLFAETLTNLRTNTPLIYTNKTRPGTNRSYEIGIDVLRVNGNPLVGLLKTPISPNAYNYTPVQNPLHNFHGTMDSRPNDLLMNNGVKPELPIAQWSLYYACARTYAGWNLRSANDKQARFSWSLSAQMAFRLNALDSNYRTSETEALRFQFIQLITNIVQNYNMTRNLTTPAIAVPRWSVTTLQHRLKESLTPAMNFANRVKEGLAPSVVDQVRVNSLQDMGTMVSASADGNQFVLDQAMLQVAQYEASVASLDTQNAIFEAELNQANDRFMNGVSNYKTKETAKSVWGFIKGLGQLISGVVNRDFKGFLSGCGELFGSSVSLKQMLDDFDQLRELQEKLRGFFGPSSLVLPTTASELKNFVQRAAAGNTNDPIFSKDMERSLLLLSSFDRTSADMMSVKFDSIRNYIDDLMKFSIDNKIDGAQQVVIAIKKFTVSGKGAVTAKIALADAKASFARALMQVITTRRQSKNIDAQIKKTQISMLGLRQTYLTLTTPSIINLQTELIDMLASVCNAYYYTEAEECITITDNTLKSYSIQSFQSFVDSLYGLVNRLADARPLERQAYNLDTSPLVLSSTKYPDVIESFKNSSTVTIPSAVFENMPFFRSMSAVCMKSATIELVGAKPLEEGSQARVMVKSLANPAYQRPKGGKKMLQFKTPVVSVASSYVLDGVRSASGTPLWTMDGNLYDDQSNFCRSVFQDMMLTLPSTDGIDLSGVTAIKIYLSGTGVLGNLRMSVASTEYEPAQLW